MTATIFLDLHLPNATTWFYFSALLAVALFFKFSRLLSIRNLDILTLFLFMPGLLLLVESAGHSRWGYVWLLAASGYFLVRCLFDLILDRRPALSPNLSLGGLIWLAVALFVSLVAVAVRQAPHQTGAVSSHDDPNGGPGDKRRTPLDGAVLRPVEDLVRTHGVPPSQGVDVGPWVERGLVLFCHLLIVVCMVLIGWKHFGDLHGGVAAATCYLVLPYTFLLLPSHSQSFARWDHAWPMALMVGMVLAYCRPTISGALLGLAAGGAIVPVLTLPVWVSFYWKRGTCRFILAFLIALGLSIGVLALIMWYHGNLPQSLQSGWTASSWQPWKAPPPEMQSIWKGAHYAYRIPVCILFLAFVLVTLFWPAPKNLAHAIALSAAILLGVQFWYTDHGGVYILWFLPYLLLLVFRPNLSSCRPPPLTNDLLARLGRHLRQRLRRWLQVREPVARVQ